MVILFFVQTAFAADGKWVQREGVGTGGTNWTEWTDANNWTGGVVAAGSTSHADLTASKGQYIRLPNETVSLKSIAGDVTSSSVLYGDALLQFGSPAADFKYIALYTPWKWSHNSVYSGPYGVSVCADCTYLYGNCLWFDTNRIRLDRYANSSDPVRVNACLPKDQGIKVNSTGGLVFMAPCGSSTNQTYSWSQTEGSRFLAPCAATGVLPVGAIVTGDGILPGTFLKRVFPDGTIELSTAVETTDTENELTFAPLRSDTTVRLGGYRGYNSSGLKFLIVEKYREEDDFRVEISYFGKDFDTVANNGTFRLYTEDGFVPGVIALISDSAAEAVLKLENIRLEIDANYSGLQLTVPNDAAHEARVSVTGSLTKAVGRLSSVVGTFRKEGMGTLVVNELNAPVANLKVAEGALSVTAADEGLTISRLTIAAGARFDVPASGIFCEILDIGEGATIGGSGVLTYRTLAGGALPDIIVKGSAIVRAEVPEAAEFSVRVMNGAYTAYTKDGDDVLVFDSSATIAVAGTGTVSMLVVGGGGGGGQYRGGGGGGGGVIETNDVVVTPGVYAFTVGEGGAAAVGSASGLNGEASTAFGVTALGGGGGGTQKAGNDGGSGGGGGAPGYGNYATNSFGLGTAGQGFEGSAGVAQGSHWSAAGGGGGGAGQSALPYRLNSANRGVGGRGGDGKFSSIWVPQYYGGGGNGGCATADYGYSRAGRGGGGKAGVVNANSVVIADGEPGVDGLGGGGGGGGDFVSAHAPAGRGGRGTIILRLANPHGDYVFPEHAGCATGGDEIRYRRHHWIHTFTNDASFVVSQGVFADVLLVGGGGGGGSSGGGGGGGGAVVAITNLYLPAGTYPIVIGKGGSGTQGGAGKATSGTSTTLMQQDGTIRLQALGGGAGGTRSIGSHGGPGGGGGAGYYYNDTTPGYVGGDDVLGPCPSGGHSTNVVKDIYSCQGGGGAGAGRPGADATGSRGGDGGDGIAVDFSGTMRYYGGGGGGGSAKTGEYPTAGGQGGGGRGSGIKSYPVCYNAEHGADGLGGGGGGGAAAGDNSDPSGFSGNGGCGCVIIRYAVQPTGLMMIVR